MFASVHSVLCSQPKQTKRTVYNYNNKAGGLDANPSMFRPRPYTRVFEPLIVSVTYSTAGPLTHS